MKRIDQRRRRLLKEGFAIQEARDISKATDIRLADPVLKELRRDRRAALRAAKATGPRAKTRVSREIVVELTAGGFVDKRGRITPLRHLESFGKRPRVVEIIRQREVARTSDAGFTGRFNILRRAGFFTFEARILAAMKGISAGKRQETFRSAPWQAMLKSRAGYIEKMLGKAIASVRKELGAKRFNDLTTSEVRHLALAKIERMLRRWYKTEHVDPFAWLKAEYRPKTRPPSESELKARQRVRKGKRKFVGTKRQAERYIAPKTEEEEAADKRIVAGRQFRDKRAASSRQRP